MSITTVYFSMSNPSLSRGAAYSRAYRLNKEIRSGCRIIGRTQACNDADREGRTVAASWHSPVVTDHASR
jgi:hypothetical protein